MIEGQPCHLLYLIEGQLCHLLYLIKGQPCHLLYLIKGQPCHLLYLPQYMSRYPHLNLVEFVRTLQPAQRTLCLQTKLPFYFFTLSETKQLSPPPLFSQGSHIPSGLHKIEPLDCRKDDFQRRI